MPRERTYTVALSAVILLWTTATLFAQECHYVHPPAPPQASDFPQPPSDGHTRFSGPVIRQVNVQCWYAEPSEPSKCIGGAHGFQKVPAFLPTGEISDPALVDTAFRQKAPLPFSGGGATSDLKPDDLPAGVFVSFKGHPIFKVNQVQYPTQSQEPPLDRQSKTGVTVAVEFQHEPSSGECYLYVAAWMAVK